MDRLRRKDFGDEGRHLTYMAYELDGKLLMKTMDLDLSTAWDFPLRPFPVQSRK